MPWGVNVLAVHDAFMAEAAEMEFTPANSAAATTTVLRIFDIG